MPNWDWLSLHCNTEWEILRGEGKVRIFQPAKGVLINKRK